MRRNRGVVLINALIIVLAISAITAALLARAESVRRNAAASQDGEQLVLYLDGVEDFLPALLVEPLRDGTAHRGQPWAAGPFSYTIGRGTVTARIEDLQGRLNVNWLSRESDQYAFDTFSLLFAELNLPPSLMRAIADYLRPGGPRDANAYLGRPVPLLPSGGPTATLQELRQVEGMSAADYARLEPYVSALPPDTRLNLNTAPDPVLRAALAPYPPELVTETLARKPSDPPLTMSGFRRRLQEILGSEDLGDLPIDRIQTASMWFQARMMARLQDRRRSRLVVYSRSDPNAKRLSVRYRWALRD